MSTRLDKVELFASVGYSPHEKQLVVHASSAPRLVLACGVRFGKTTVGVHEALAALLAPGPASCGWIVTPAAATTALLTGPLFAMLRTYFAHRLVEVDERERRAVVRNLGGNLSEVVGKCADRPAALLGASLAWLIVNEAARLPDDLWTTVLSQRLVDRRGWALVSSTPRGASGWFHGEYLRGVRGDEGYASWRSPTWANPAIDPEVVALEQTRLSPRVFASEFGAEFLGEAGVECATCGWGRAAQRSFMSAAEWRECRRCGDCGRTLTAEGVPVGFEREDGSIGLQVFCGPEDDVETLWALQPGVEREDA